MRVATVSGPSAWRRAVTSASGCVRPCAASWPTAPVSICHRCSRPGSARRRPVTSRAWSTFSTTQAAAPESASIHSAWEAEEVG